MPNSRDTYYRNHLRAAINSCILVLVAVRDKPNASYEEKLKAVDTVAKYLPEIKRSLIYLLNLEKSNGNNTLP